MAIVIDLAFRHCMQKAEAGHDHHSSSSMIDDDVWLVFGSLQSFSSYSNMAMSHGAITQTTTHVRMHRVHVYNPIANGWPAFMLLLCCCW